MWACERALDRAKRAERAFPSRARHGVLAPGRDAQCSEGRGTPARGHASGAGDTPSLGAVAHQMRLQLVDRVFLSAVEDVVEEGHYRGLIGGDAPHRAPRAPRWKSATAVNAS